MSESDIRDTNRTSVIVLLILIFALVLSIFIYNNQIDTSYDDQITIEQDKYELQCNHAQNLEEYDACIKLNYAINYGCD